MRMMTLVLPKSEDGKPPKTVRSYVKRRLDRLGVEAARIHVDGIVVDLFFRDDLPEDVESSIWSMFDDWVDRRTREFKNGRSTL